MQIKDLKLDKTGKVKPTSENLKLVSRLTVVDLKDDLVKKYTTSVDRLNKGYDQLAAKADKDYGVK